MNRNERRAYARSFGSSESCKLMPLSKQLYYYFVHFMQSNIESNP